MVRPSSLAVAFLVLTLVGCGGDGGGGSKTKSVAISAPGDTILPGGTLSLTAIVKGGGKVVWSVDGGSENGTVTSTGLYTAPSTQGTYVVRATVGEASATKTVEVFNGISLALTANATPPLTIPRSKLTFVAAVNGSSDKVVNWTTTGGTIGADGTFTAPNAPGSYTVTGTSHADPTKTVSATVQVVANVNVRFQWQGKGDVVIALRPDKAPGGAANFVTLVNKGFYEDIVLHRYEADFVVQWGDPTTKGLTSGAFPNVDFEVNDLLNVKYSLAYARIGDDANSGSTQVFVNLKDNAFLNHQEDDLGTPEDESVQGYSVFGAVLSGQATVDALRQNDKIVSAKTEALP